MQILEQTLEEIGRLKKDLNARVIVKVPSKYETQTGTETHQYTFRPVAVEEQVLIPEHEEPGEPDTQKREAAKQELQQHYESCPWYSGRYRAGKVLIVDEGELDERLEGWLEELEKEKSLKTHEITSYSVRANVDSQEYEKFKIKPIDENIKRIEKAREDLKDFYKIAETRELRQKIGETIGYTGISILVDEFKRGTRLIEDELKKIYGAKKYYFISDADKRVRIKAGQALGYSRLRIWLHGFWK